MVPHGDRDGVAPLSMTCASVQHFVLFGIGEELFSFADWYPGERKPKVHSLGLVP